MILFDTAGPFGQLQLISTGNWDGLKWSLCSGILQPLLEASWAAEEVYLALIWCWMTIQFSTVVTLLNMAPTSGLQQRWLSLPGVLLATDTRTSWFY